METLLLLGLNTQAWITIAIILTMFALLMFTRIPADIVFAGGMGALLLTGVLDAKEALAGFSSISVVTIGVLFVVIAGLVNTGVIQCMVRYVLGRPTSYNNAIVRIMLPVATLSSVLSNTTVVALFVNVVKVWSRKLNIAPSRLLIPMSYASCAGGVCILIGTPPNLIISGFYMRDTHEELNIFITTLPGLFCLAVCILSMLALRRLLPERKSPEEAFLSIQDYTIELLVPTDNPHVGKTIEEVGLQSVRGGHLIEIMRFDKEIITPVSSDEYIMGGDHLIYTGQIEEIIELRRTHHFVNAPHHVFSLSEIERGRKLRTATISHRSSLIGKTLGSTTFEQDNNIAIVAISRKGELIQGSPREAELHEGDTLLIECPGSAHRTIAKTMQQDLMFFDSEEIKNIGIPTIISSLIMIGMVLLSSFGVMSLLNACFLAAFAMLLSRCCTVEQARNSINWNILIIFAGSICLGTAIEKTGIAQSIATNILSICGTNPLIVLICLCFVGTFATEFVSNTACAAMIYPIAYQTVTTLGANPLTFCIALMIALSSSFATPIGSPTHMLVYGVGGYKFTDFMKIGLITNVIMLIANIFIVTLLFPL